MGRVAVVTGGTRGIGHAISIALKHKGCRVAATYAGNDAAARQFQADTGIPVYKFDVGDYAACQDGVTRIARDLGPRRHPRQQRRHHARDAMLHRMKRRTGTRSVTNLDSVFNMTRLVIEAACARAASAASSTSPPSTAARARMGQTNTRPPRRGCSASPRRWRRRARARASTSTSSRRATSAPRW